MNQDFDTTDADALESLKADMLNKALRELANSKARRAHKLELLDWISEPVVDPDRGAPAPFSFQDCAESFDMPAHVLRDYLLRIFRNF